MKRTLSLVALAAVASLAAPVKFGADALVGYNLTMIGSDMEDEGETIDAKFGFGVSVGPTAAYQINDKFSIGAGVLFNYDMFGMESSYEGVDEKATVDVTVMSLGLQLAPSFQINDKISVKAGYEWDMPLSGTSKVEAGDFSSESDLVWAPAKYEDVGEKEFPAASIHNIVLGGAYAINPNLAVSLQAKYALNGFAAEYEDNGDYKGAYESSKNITNHQIAVGASYAFGN